MSFPRFFCSLDLATAFKQNTAVSLDSALAHYMQRVLRLPNQSHVVLFTGQGGQYTATLHYEGKAVHAQLTAFDPIERELPWRIGIAQGLATGDKMDWVCEKSVEMGASHLYPIAAQHSTLKLSGARLEKRLAHWQRIAQSASEQCGRNQVLEVAPLQSLAELLAHHADPSQTAVLFCDPDAEHDFPTAIKEAAASNQRHWILLIGPEGGWSTEEKKMAQESGAIAMRFGARVLRTETAAIALLGAIRGQLDWVD